jgi:hypothetical protein
VVCLCGQALGARCRIAIMAAVARDCAAKILQILTGCYLTTDECERIRGLGLEVRSFVKQLDVGMARRVLLEAH